MNATYTDRARSSGPGHSQARSRQLTPKLHKLQKQEKTQNKEYIDFKRTICRTTSEEAICAQKTENI